MNFIIIYLVILMSGVLWRLGGNGYKWARTLVLPALLALTKFYLVGYWLNPINYVVLGYALALWAMIAGFSYGLSAPPHKFWVWVFGTGDTGEVWYVELATRATCGFFWALAGAVFALVTGAWIVLGVYTIFLTIAVGIIGAFAEEVNISEFSIGCCVATALLI